ncbi:hypothetical protein GCU67_20690 [Modestobacter muralis]|uniref:Conjugal transfer protein n=1 Tax=Modestobacter muralis TaxID=1608614 RepID=A0A6P0HDV6_9ACTN|nr:hypothetical protein [Modestobacter muralis]NEK96563.1 hypothetical protein [Modestobacter muralis]NEN53463.1 hypothetical protein [Modestobacter muralis]
MDLRTAARSVLGLDARDAKRAASTAAGGAGNGESFGGSNAAGWSTSRPGRRTHVGFRVAAWAGVILLLVAGIVQVIVRPIANAVSRDEAPAAAAPALDPDAAQALAVAYATDYLSFDSASPGTRAAAVARWTGETSGPGIANWSGDGQLHVDVVTAGTVLPLGTDAAVVAVTARVTPAVLAEGQAVPEAAAVSDAGVPVAADPGPAVAPWTAQSPRWLTLHVPVVLTDGEPTVAGSGAVFSSGRPASIPRPDASTDNALTGDTGDLPGDVFTAVADGSTDYIAASGATLPDLAGALTVADTANWSVSGGSTTRYAAATVDWQLAGTTLQISQRYALQLTDNDGRWLVTAVDATNEEIR